MDTRLVLIPFILVMLAVIEVDNRNFLHRNFTDEELKGYHSPFASLIACAVIFIVLMFLFPSHNDEYQEIKEKYEDLSSSVESSYDDAVCVKGYFLEWGEASFEDAKDSMKNLYDNLYPGEW